MKNLLKPDPTQPVTTSSSQLPPSSVVATTTTTTTPAVKDEKEPKAAITSVSNIDANKNNNNVNVQQPQINLDSLMADMKGVAPKEIKPKFPENAPPELDTKSKSTVNSSIANFDAFPSSLPNAINASNASTTTTTATLSSNGNLTATLPFLDPLEHSLASMESSQEKQADMDAILRDIQKHHSLVNQLTVPHLPQQQQPQQQQAPHNPNAALNHLVSEFNGMNNGGNAMNGIMNILGMQHDVANNLPFVNHPMKGAWPNSMPVPPLQGLTLLNTEAAQNAVNFSQKNEKMLLTPKPIEELLATPMSNDKSKILLPNDARVSHAFGQTFKYEQNLKNASSWSQLASTTEASQVGANKSRLPSDTFQEFRTKAKELQQRQKQQQQEQEKIKMQKEQEFKRQQENLFKQGKNEEANLTQR